MAEEPAIPGLFDRSRLGYSEPVIDPASIADALGAPAPVTVNLLLALLLTAIFGASGVILRFLHTAYERDLARIFRRLPLQALLTLILIWLFHLLLPTASAQEPGPASVSLLQVPLYAFLFFVIVGTSNFVFNNILTSEGDRLHEFVVAHPVLDRAIGGRSHLSTEIWLIILFVLLYAMVGAYINPSFSLFPSQNIGIVLIAVTSIAIAAYAKDGLRFLIAKGWKCPAWFKANLPGLCIAILCVAISRELRLSPGFIYGLPAGVFIVLHDRRPAGLLEFFGLVSMLLLALAAWLLLPWLHAYQILSDTCALLFVILTEAAFFEMLPVPYLSGGVIFGWRKAVWAVEFFAAAFLLFQTLFNTKGTIAGLQQSPPAVLTLMFLGFYVVGVLLLLAYILWARRRPASPTPDNTTMPV